MKEEGKIREENANDSSDDSGEETGGLALAVPGPRQTLPARAGVWVRGGDFHGAKLTKPCVPFQMSLSTQVKRRRTWQRSEFWVHLMEVACEFKGPRGFWPFLSSSHKLLIQGRK